MTPVNRIGEVHNGRRVIAAAPDDVTPRRRARRSGRGIAIVRQRTKMWSVQCLSCGGRTTTSWQAVRLKGCHACTMKARRKDPEHVAAVIAQTAWRNGARVRGLAWELTLEDVARIMRSPCHYCGASDSNEVRKRGLTFRHNGCDRVDNARGYHPDNVVPCCAVCNRAKLTMGYADFVAWLDRVATFRGRP